jgi:hypothetical protein
MVNRTLAFRRPSPAAVLVACAGSLAVVLAAAAGASILVVLAAGGLAVVLIAVAEHHDHRHYAAVLGPPSAGAGEVSIAAPTASDVIQRGSGTAAA